MSQRKAQSLRAQQILVVIAIVLFVCKLWAFYLTGSVAILTDALESTVNVVAGFIGLYSLRLSARPRDANHPYGHGKVEFLSAAVEGTLVLVAGMIIIYEAALNLRNPHSLQRIDVGIAVISATAVVNYIVGEYCVRTGKRNSSLALMASGAHLKTDTYTTIGLVIGLILLYLTGLKWLDSAVALVFALIIIRTGFKIIRESVSGIMDEADGALVEQIVTVLSAHRRVNWIDIHHVRIINYAGFFHIDCHLTVPRYFTVDRAHDEVDALTAVLEEQFAGEVEFSIHTDPCIPTQCSLCEQHYCPVRATPFVELAAWNAENIQQNQKHQR